MTGKALESLAVARVMLRSGRDVEIAAVGTSMEPAISAGALLRLRRPPRDLAVGDVVSVDTIAGVITHRIIALDRRGYLLMRGDAETLCDKPVRRDAVLGVVVAALREGAWRPVPVAARTGFRHAAAGGAFAFVVRLALRVNPRLAMSLVHAALGLGSSRTLGTAKP